MKKLLSWADYEDNVEASSDISSNDAGTSVTATQQEAVTETKLTAVTNEKIQIATESVTVINQAHHEMPATQIQEDISPAGTEDDDEAGETTTTGAAGGSTGLENLQMWAARLKVDDKQIINCHADLNQLVPFKYKWHGQNIYRLAQTTGCQMKSICLLTLRYGKVPMD